MKPLIAFSGLAAALFLASAADAGQFITNGDFTQLSNGLGQLTNNTIATGWSVPSGGYTLVFTTADQAVPGQYGGLSLWDAANGGNSSWNGLAAGSGNFAAIDGDFQNQPLTQLITGLTVGKSYQLNFNYAFGQQYGFDGATEQNLTYSLGGTSFTTPTFNVTNHGFTGWQSVDATFTANSASELLSFAAYGNLPVPPFALVSDVSLTSVPEPATWAMMILGLAGLGIVVRQRRANSASTAAA
jgi:hypothetical protein